MASSLDLSNYEKICEEVYKVLLEELSMEDQEVRRTISRTVSQSALAQDLDFPERKALEERIFNHFRRLDILQPLLDNPQITEIMVNGPEEIFYEREGKIYRSPERFRSTEDLTHIITGFFSKYNEPLSNSVPMNSLRLPDGSRANAVLPPISQGSPILTIRKFTGIRPSLPNLISQGFITEEMASYLIQAVQDKKAIIIGGGTGSGKTTLLNILSAYIPERERIITIEDSPELQLQNRVNWVKLCTREEGPDGTMAIDSGSLIKNALRMRPDRIIVGEVRGPEAYDMLQAAMSGHPGTLCTVHGNDCKSMFLRTADLILSYSKLDYDMILRQLTDAFDLLIHIHRTEEGDRYIDEICQILPDDAKHFSLKTIYERRGDCA